MAFGLGFGIGFCRRFGAVVVDPGTIEGTPVSIVDAVEGDTIGSVITWGSMDATVGALGPPERVVTLNGVVLDPYDPDTVLVIADELEAEETFTSSSGATRTDTAGPMITVGTPATTFPTLRSRAISVPSTANSTTHAIPNPSGATSGDLVVHIFGTDGNAGTLSQAVGSGWTISTPTLNAGADEVTAATAWKVLNGSGDSLTIGTTSPEQSIRASFCFSAFSGDPIISTMATPSGTVSPDGPSVSFGGSEACRVITAVIASQATGVQTAAPSGYGNLQATASGGSGVGSVRLATAEKEVSGTSEDPPAWSVSNVDPITVTIAVRG